MPDKYAELQKLIDASQSYDEHMSLTLGRCQLYGTDVHINTGIQSSRLLEATKEHELTHRSDICNTHFGNLYTLINNAKKFLNSFSITHRNLILKLIECFSSNNYKLCFEGRAKYNERRFFDDIPEKEWLNALNEIDDKSYYEGYGIASNIMSHFSLRDEIYI
ncbi:unnamed protein product, partial [marine sediment metagenome]